MKKACAIRKLYRGFVLAILAGATLVAAPSNAIERTVCAAKLKEGPVKVVFLASYAPLQDAFELMQRVEIRGTVVPVTADPRLVKDQFGIQTFYWPDLGTTADRTLDDIRRALKTDWQVLAISSSNLDWSTYPEDIRKSILASVARGRAMVTNNMGKPLMDDIASTGLSLEATDILDGHFKSTQDTGPDFKVYRCGRGYMASLDPPKDPASSYLLSESPSQADFELSAAKIGWLIRRIGHPKALPSIKLLQVSDGIVSLAASPRAFRMRISIRSQDDYEEVYRAVRKLQLDTKLPHLASGLYQIQVAVEDEKGRTLDWDSRVFRNSGPVELKSIRSSRTSVKEGELLNCHLEVNGSAPGLRYVIRWFDNWNRLLLETTPRPYVSDISVRVPQGSLSVINRVQVTLLSLRGPEAKRAIEVLMPQNVRPADDYYVLYWGLGSPSWRYRLYYEVLRQAGMADASSNCGRTADVARTCALSGFRTVPYTTGFYAVTLSDQLFDERWNADTGIMARETVRAQKSYNVLAYTLGDENYVTAFDIKGRFCDTPVFWKGFQDYLRGIYPDIKSLNAQWGTVFGSWSEIHFQKEKELLPSLDNPSIWFDYRMFVSHEFAAAQQRMRAIIQEEDPGAVVGWDGCEQYSSYDGYDWWQLTRGMGLNNVYSNFIVPGVSSTKLFNGEAVKSFKPDAVLSGGWLNGVDRYCGGEWDTWYSFLKGWNSAWWWAGTYLNPEVGACTWDLKMTPVAGDMARAAKEIKNGPATLLAHARIEVDPIAIHYSENNWHASTIESGIANHINNLGLMVDFWTDPHLAVRGGWTGMDKDTIELWSGITPKGHCAAASRSFYLLFHDLGFQPRTMARQEIESGELNASKTKVMVLPFVVSLSDAEVEKIRAFVENGGVLIADYRCGLRDLHGRLRPIAPLDDVFGVRRLNGEVKRGRASVVAEFSSSHGSFGAKFETMFHDSVVAVGSATARAYHDDGTPAFIVNSFGKGKAIYLNTDLYDYDQMRRHGHEIDVRELMRSLIDDTAGVAAPFVPMEHGRPASHTEVVRYTDGGVHYVGLLPDYAVDDRRPMNVVLPFDRGLHVYDIRNKTYLGCSGFVERTLEPGEAALYAVLPCKVASIEIIGPKVVRRGERVVFRIRVNARGGTPGTHAARVRVAFPSGVTPEYLTRTILLNAGNGAFELTPALSEETGVWKMEATETVSGQKSEMRFVVR